MEIKIVAFGIARDIIGAKELQLIVPDESTVAQVLDLLKARFAAFDKLTSLLLAVNESYADSEVIIQEGDELVLIPPVSGG